MCGMECGGGSAQNTLATATGTLTLTLTLAFSSAWRAARLAVGRVDGHLDVGAAALDAHLADDGHRRVAQPLVLLVRQRLRSQALG